MIVVAGHLCLDIIPGIGTDAPFEPGRLIEVGKATVSTGGAVSNVGIALHKLGAQVRLIGKIGRDPFGRLVSDVLEPFGLAGDTILSDDQTSYSIVISRPGQDRIFLHCSGCNDTFVTQDLDLRKLEGASHFHFGYPSLMAQMSANSGKELVELFTNVKALGISTSLDMSYPDPASAQGKLDWAKVLSNVLPLVDYFFPSEDELSFMLPDQGGFNSLAKHCQSLGAKHVVIKRGNLGLFGLDSDDKEFHQPCFEVDVVGTTGSGDTTIAGILYGLSQGFSFAKSLEAGCAVGACCVTSADATSGIVPWAQTKAEFAI